METWKKTLLRAAGVGAGFAFVAALIVGAALWWYSSRAQSWDASTIKGTNTTVSQTFDLDEQKKDYIASGFMLVFILQNTSGKDYTVPENLRLFERSSKSGALEELKVKLDHPFVVPAKEKTEVHASMEYGCSDEDMATGKTTERDGATCFKDAFGNVTDFVGFDDATHTRLNLPKPIFYGGTAEPAKTGVGMAPGRGKP
jgi:hypothetical protein